MNNEKLSREMEAEVLDFVEELGVSNENGASKIIAQSICAILTNGSSKYNDVNDLYEEIAKRSETPVGIVKKVMRYNFKQAWRQGKILRNENKLRQNLYICRLIAREFKNSRGMVKNDS